ncbi:hypothetical protein ACU8KH_00749 [Lachancea thermotolerans]
MKLIETRRCTNASSCDSSGASLGTSSRQHLFEKFIEVLKMGPTCLPEFHIPCAKDLEHHIIDMASVQLGTVQRGAI